MARTFRIFPSIGIARMGDSSSGWYVGPEAPALGFVPPDGAHRDAPGANGRIKRMAARFRIYEFDDDTPVREVTETAPDIESIEWEVRLANSKAADASLNPGIPLADLTIDTGATSIKGLGKHKVLNGTLRATSPDTRVRLGDLRTDEAGRLLVLGGHGMAERWRDVQPQGIRNSAWYDDASDGPVRARVKVSGESDPEQAVGAWVVVGPPDFAHGLECIVTLYDLARHLAGPFLFRPDDPQVSFTEEIYPVLRRAVYLQWAHDGARTGHSGARPGNFLSAATFPLLHDRQAAGGDEARGRVLERLKDPADPFGSGNMPALTGLTLTPTQYRRFQRWGAGDFVDDWPAAWDPMAPPQPAFKDIPIPAQPDALTRAALDACVGGSFNPGIEVGETAALASTYEQPFRVSRTVLPGDLTHHLGVPWQADFNMCRVTWWPSARPDRVLSTAGGTDAHRLWARGVDDNAGMVAKWRKLGFVVRDSSSADIRYVESERTL